MPEMRFVLDKKDLAPFVAKLGKEYEIIAPVKKNGSYIFNVISNAEEMSLDYDTTILPPKKLFLPPREKLFSFSRAMPMSVANSVAITEPEEEEARKILFGVHPCDVNAILLLDKVMEGDFPDPYYFRRRRNTIIAAFNCTEARGNCFCTSFDTGPELRNGYDLLFTDLGEKYLVEIGTDAGKKIIERAKVREAKKEDVSKKNAEIESVKKKIEKRIKTENLTEDLQKNFNHEKWKEVKDECLFCGSCTLVCPTCFCYEVIDRNKHDLKGGERIRSWDSCLTLEFAEVALGGNFRREREARVKQRIYHKLVYFAEQFGSFGCVGCGRCIDTCIKGIDIVEVVNEIREG
jgi:ferredoxin